MTNVLIYTRLSTEDLHESTDRQEAYCRSYAEARGWTVLDVIRDVDASAYLPGSRRPGSKSSSPRPRPGRVTASSCGSWIDSSDGPLTSSGCGRSQIGAASSSRR